VWTEKLRTNPIGLLFASDDTALVFRLEQNLLKCPEQSPEILWELPEVKKLLKKQQKDGSWKFRGNRPGDEWGENYELIETWRNMRFLVEMYCMHRGHPAVERASEFILGCQTEEGDIRGILSNQYMPYYMGAIMEILIKAGYQEDKRIENGFIWLIRNRQDDGGWIIPMAMYNTREYYSLCQKPPIPPDRSLPSSHMATGMVIRAFAAHPEYRKSEEAIRAGNLLKSRFFQTDTFNSRKTVDYWFKFQFPFWWTDLLTALDSLMRMEYSLQDTHIQKGIEWLVENQENSGGWKAAYGRGRNPNADLWVTFAVCRVLKYFLRE